MLEHSPEQSKWMEKKKTTWKTKNVSIQLVRHNPNWFENMLFTLSLQGQALGADRVRAKTLYGVILFIFLFCISAVF